MKPTLALRNFLLGSSLLAALLASPAAFAGNTWDGGASGSWLDTTNWDSNTAPSTGVALTFVGNLQNSTTNDLVAVDPSFAGILFTNDGTAGKTNAFTLAGSRITLGGNITTSASVSLAATITDIISLNMILDGNRTITTNQRDATRRHDLTISGIISETGGPRNLIKAGGANTILILSNANTYSGSTTISGGRLELNHLNAIQNTASVSVASGTSLQLNVAGTYGNTSAITLVGGGAAGQSNPGALCFGSGGATEPP